MVDAIPKGVGSLVPYLCVRGAMKAIEFYRAAFGAELVSMMPMGEGLVGHADLRIGSSRLYLADEMPGWGAVQSPKALKGTTTNIHLWVEDCDATFAQALAAGAKVAMPLTDQFWGDRYGMLTDPFGHMWAISTHKEDLTEEEMMRRGDEAMAHMAQTDPKPTAKTKKKVMASGAEVEEPLKEKPLKKDKAAKKAEKAARKAEKAAHKAQKKAKDRESKKDKKGQKESKH